MGTLHSKYVLGNLVFYQDREDRWVDALGSGVVKYLDHFVGSHVPSADSPAGWVVTLVEAGGGESTAALGDAAGGTLVLTADANEDDGAQLQLDNEPFKLVAGNPLYFGIRFALSEATQSDALVGLAVTDTTLLASAPGDGVYFRKDDGDAYLDFVTEKDTTATTATAVATLVDATYVTAEFYFDGAGVVRAYLNGTLVASHTTNVVNDEELAPSIAFLSGAAGAGKTLTVDWVRVIQINA